MKKRRIHCSTILKYIFGIFAAASATTALYKGPQFVLTAMFFVMLAIVSAYWELDQEMDDYFKP